MSTSPTDKPRSQLDCMIGAMQCFAPNPCGDGHLCIHHQIARAAQQCTKSAERPSMTFDQYWRDASDGCSDDPAMAEMLKAWAQDAWNQAVKSLTPSAIRATDAAQVAYDQQSDDPAPGDWNDACRHIAELLRRADRTVQNK